MDISCVEDILEQAQRPSLGSVSLTKAWGLATAAVGEEGAYLTTLVPAALVLVCTSLALACTC